MFSIPASARVGSGGDVDSSVEPVDLYRRAVEVAIMRCGILVKRAWRARPDDKRPKRSVTDMALRIYNSEALVDPYQRQLPSPVGF
jgi:hypothetical protein